MRFDIENLTTHCIAIFVPLNSYRLLNIKIFLTLYLDKDDIAMFWAFLLVTWSVRGKKIISDVDMMANQIDLHCSIKLKYSG